MSLIAYTVKSVVKYMTLWSVNHPTIRVINTTVHGVISVWYAHSDIVFYSVYMLVSRMTIYGITAM